MGFASRGVFAPDILAALTLDNTKFNGAALVDVFNHNLTVAKLQAMANFSGTLGGAENLTNGNTGTGANELTQDDWAVKDMAAPYLVKQFRHFGNIINNADGEWVLLTSYDNVNWDTWATFATRATADWSDWTECHVMAARYIKIVATTIDTGGMSRMGELEIKY